MKRIIVALFFMASPALAITKTAVMMGDGTLQANTTGFHVQKAIVSTMTINNSIQFSIGPVAGATTSLVVGGSLTFGDTYYYKVWPYNQNGILGFASPEMRVIPTSSSKTVTVSWTLLSGASYYRVSQGNGSDGQGGPDGWWQTALTTFTATGQAYDSSVNISNLQRPTLSLPGPFSLQAGMTGFTFQDFATGNPYGFGPTSAGEWTFESGTGDGEGFYYFYDGGGTLGILFETNNSAGISFGNGSRSGYLATSELEIVIGDVVRDQFNTSSTTFNTSVLINNTGSIGTTVVPFEIRSTTNSTVNVMSVRDGPGNVVAGIDYGGGFYPTSRTLAVIQAYVPTSVGTVFYCNNCTIDALCVSTGTSAGQFVSISSRPRACQ